jgi:energy-converting hydrogenase Eha subunit B
MSCVKITKVNGDTPTLCANHITNCNYNITGSACSRHLHGVAVDADAVVGLEQAPADGAEVLEVGADVRRRSGNLGGGTLRVVNVREHAHTSAGLAHARVLQYTSTCACALARVRQWRAAPA